MKKIFLTVSTIVLVFSFLNAQDEAPAPKLFTGYLAAGLNASQIDGDQMGGYTKVGAIAGVGTYINVTEKFLMSLEMAYSMRGARSQFVNNNPFTFRKYATDYIQLPVLFNFKHPKAGIFGAGITTAILVRQNFDSAINLFMDARLTTFDFAATFSYTYIFTEKLGANFNFNYSLSNNLEGSIRRGGWYHNFMSFRLFYLFN